MFIVLLFAVLLMIIYAVYLIVVKKCKKEPYYKEKKPSKQIEYELTNVANSRDSMYVGEYRNPAHLIKDLNGEEESLNSERHGVNEPGSLGL